MAIRRRSKSESAYQELPHSEKYDRTSRATDIPFDKIAIRAYDNWVRRGRPQGSHVQDWFEAEAELRAELANVGTRSDSARTESQQSKESHRKPRSATNPRPKDAEPRNRVETIASQFLTGDTATRTKALNALSDLGSDAKLAILLIVLALDDADGDNRYLSFQLLCQICPAFRNSDASRIAAFESDDHEVRLAGIRDAVTILPAVQRAIRARAIGWRELSARLKQPPGTKHANPFLATRSEPPATVVDNDPIMEDPMRDASSSPSPKRLSESLDPSSSVDQPNSDREEQPNYAGKWIARSADDGIILAVADTYSELLREIVGTEGPEPVIEKAPGIHPAVAARPFTLLDDESPDILEDIRRVCKPYMDPDEWLDTPNARLWGKNPRDLVGTPDEKQVRYLIRGIRYGITT